MKFFLLASIAMCLMALSVSAADTSCEKNSGVCSSKISAFNHASTNLQTYVNQLITKSYEYLLLASNFGSYKKDRPGFHKLFSKMSDEAWENSIELIKYITDRGGVMNFSANEVCSESPFTAGKNYELSEIEALAYALNVEKSLATDAICIHEKISHANKHTTYDPAVAHYLDEELIESQVETIRKLTGYVNDLKHLKDTDKPSLPTFLFDEYLAKQ